MWELKTTTVLVVMGGPPGTIKKDMENCVIKIPGNINIHELQKRTFLPTAHLSQAGPLNQGETLLASPSPWFESHLQLCQYIVYNNNNNGIQLVNGETIKKVGKEGYKYLGIMELDRMKEQEMKDILRNQYLHILGDPGADSGGEGKSKQAGKYGTKKNKERREEPWGQCLARQVPNGRCHSGF